MFFMNLELENGKNRRIRLDNADEVTFSTFCSSCDTEIKFHEDEFYEIAVKDGYHGTTWYCNDECLNEARELQGVKI